MITPEKVKQFIATAGKTSSSANTMESTAAIKAIRMYVNENLPDNVSLVAFRPMHFECSGFVRCGERYAYFNSGDFRSNGGFYARKTVDTQDYTGGRNHACTIETLVPTLVELVSGKEVENENETQTSYR